MEKFTILVITTLTLLVGVCLAAPEPAPQYAALFADFPILEVIIDIVAKIVALLTGLLGEILNLSLIGGLLESLLALGNEDPDGRR